MKGTEMNTSTVAILITLSSLSLIASTATLAIVLVGSKQMQAEVEEAKTKMNKVTQNLKSALENMEL